MFQVKKKSISRQDKLSFYSYSLIIRFLSFLEGCIDPLGKYIYIRKIIKGSEVLDIGCGNVTHLYFRILNPHSNYRGIDVKSSYYSDTEYYKLENIDFVEPDQFTDYISEISNNYDYILSIHNIEHCYNPNVIWNSMLDKLKVGGELYLRTPSKESVNFPSRKGTLNFFDDYTHTNPIPINEFIRNLDLDKFRVVTFKDPYYGSALTRSLGKLLEPLSRNKNTVLSKITWHFWGFETILVLKKIK